MALEWGRGALYYLSSIFTLYTIPQLDGQITKAKSHRQKQRQIKRQMKQALKKQNVQEKPSTSNSSPLQQVKNKSKNTAVTNNKKMKSEGDC